MTNMQTASEVLLGYGRSNGAKLASLLAVEDWQRIARQELERRATSIVQILDDSTLEAIASGALDMHTIIGKAVDEMRGVDAPESGEESHRTFSK